MAFKFQTPSLETMTQAERIASGNATAADLKDLGDRQHQHREWLNSPEGQEWLKAQAWYRPEPPETE
jgi:hypothetical protein